MACAWNCAFWVWVLHLNNNNKPGCISVPRLRSWRLRITLLRRASEAATTTSCTEWPSCKGESLDLFFLKSALQFSQNLKYYFGKKTVGEDPWGKIPSQADPGSGWAYICLGCYDGEQMVCVWRWTKIHQLPSPAGGFLSVKPDWARPASMTPQPISWWTRMLSVCFHSSNQISGFHTSKGVSEGRKDGHL